MFQDMLDAQDPSGAKSRCSRQQQNYGYLGKPAFQAYGLLRRDAAMGFFWLSFRVESWMPLRRPAGTREDISAMRKYLDEWIPRWTDSAHARTSAIGFCSSTLAELSALIIMGSIAGDLFNQEYHALINWNGCLLFACQARAQPLAKALFISGVS